MAGIYIMMRWMVLVILLDVGLITMLQFLHVKWCSDERFGNNPDAMTSVVTSANNQGLACLASGNPPVASSAINTPM